MNEIKSTEITFEEALKELELIVRRLDSGEESLEQAIKSFERAAKLKEICEVKLNEAKLKIQKVTKNSSGDITTVDHNAEDNLPF